MWDTQGWDRFPKRVRKRERERGRIRGGGGDGRENVGYPRLGTGFLKECGRGRGVG